MTNGYFFSSLPAKKREKKKREKANNRGIKT